MPTIYNLRDFEVKTNKTYFLDNNVWISLYAPLINSHERQQKNASNFLATILSKNSQIILSSLLLSEFANVILRFDFEQWKKKTCNFSASYKKDYKKTAEYLTSLNDVKDLIKVINSLEITERYSDNFNSINFERVLKNFDLDFNDAYYVQLCEINNWILVTADNDFDNLDSNIEIVKL